MTLGLSFMAADFCLMVWGGDPLNVTTPDGLGGFVRVGALAFPMYRLAIIVIAIDRRGRACGCCSTARGSAP